MSKQTTTDDVIVSADPPEASTSKRRASASGKPEEPEEKRSRRETVPVANEGGSSSHQQGFGILDEMAKLIKGPIAMNDTFSIVINTIGMNNYFTTLRSALLTAVYPNSTFIPANIVSNDHFRLVCRFLTKARIDHVYSSITGKRGSSRVPMSRDYILPKALADIINGFGAITVRNGAMTFIPEPEADPTEANLRLVNTVTHAMLTSFKELVQAAYSERLIHVDFLSSTTVGTAW